MELPKRKPNRLASYDYSQNGAYFVTICTQDRRRILSKIVGDDALIVPTSYGRIVERYIRNTQEIEKYVIMPDHIHMIIRLDDGTVTDGRVSRDPAPCAKAKSRVSQIIRSIKGLATKEIGEPIFQRSYYDHVIRNQRDYNECWEYIDNNPRKWVIMKKGVE